MKTPRNSLKGYTYQQYIFAILLAKMDVDREIDVIESEAIGTKQFDDVYIKMKNGIEYRVQVKNYRDITLDDISVSGNIARIKTNANEYNSEDNNVMIVKMESMDVTGTETDFLGIPAVKIDDIIVVPVSTYDAENYLQSWYINEERALQILLKAYELTINEKFKMTLEDLPQIIKLSTDLQNKTVLIRKVPEKLDEGITYIVGKPGVGKSHYVDELKKFYKDAIIYRFWIGAQDVTLQSRLQYNRFLQEMAVIVQEAPKKISASQLIEKISQSNRVVIIDGLDHVENYNPNELDYYIDFINKLAETKIKTIVLSRPLARKVSWKRIELFEWDFDETQIYLQVAYDIKSYDVQKQIYKVSQGYPIITYFLAEHYQKYRKIDIDEQIDSVDMYYDQLTANVKTKSLLSVFAVSNSFFTWNELYSFFDEPELFGILKEFVEAYPYLFDIVHNRVALIHDSLNTYLRKFIVAYPTRKQRTMRTIQSSLLEGNIEYMARLSSYELEEGIVNELIRKYSHFENYRRLIESSIDFNSVSSFYLQLQRLLEDRMETLNAYEYYSFSLIFQVATRNDMVGYDGILYEILAYLNQRGEIENYIFSSGELWNVFLTCSDKANISKEQYRKSLYGEQQYQEQVEQIVYEQNFFERLNNKISFEDVLIRLDEKKKNGDIHKDDVLVDYLVSLIVNEDSSYKLYDEFKKYLDNHDGSIFQDAFIELGFDGFYCDYIPNKAEFILHGLGLFGDKNNFRSYTIKEKIKELAPKGSFNVGPAIEAMLRLANYENREIDICSINYFCGMYGNRKDYSVYTIEDALILFEEKKLISDGDSIEIIHRLMEQSEKGIRHLMNSYINKKDNVSLEKMIQNGYFDEWNCKASAFELKPERIDVFPKKYIEESLKEILRYGWRSKMVEADDIENPLKSSYCKMITDALDYYEFHVYGNFDDKKLIDLLIEEGIEYLPKDAEKETKYVPFEHGYIHENDFEYIEEQKISAIDISQYADGWYGCLPYPYFYDIYEKEELKRSCLNILHQSLFVRVVDKEYIGNWNYVIGNIPLFYDVCGIDIDWGEIFDIFKKFLEISMIYVP